MRKEACEISGNAPRCREQGTSVIYTTFMALATACHATVAQQRTLLFSSLWPGALRSTATIVADALSKAGARDISDAIGSIQINSNNRIRNSIFFSRHRLSSRTGVRLFAFVVLPGPTHTSLHGKKPHIAKKWIGSGHGSPGEAIQLCQRVVSAALRLQAGRCLLQIG